MHAAFEVNRRYRDTGSWRNEDDQFLRWIRGPLSAGIKNTGGIRDLSYEDSDETAALVLVSNDTGVSQHEDPWQDSLHVSDGHIEYWGDAKAGVPYDDSTQNLKIRTAFERAARGNRASVPPVLVFRKPEPGVVQFCGLCVPVKFEVGKYYDDSGTQIPNYQFHFAILNVSRVPVDWLHQRAMGDSDATAPAEWAEWVETGTITRWPLGDRVTDTSGYQRRIEREERVVSGTFRDDALARFGHACVVTGIGESAVLDIAHVLSRSEHPELVEDDENVLVLNALHHRAFDADLFTLTDTQQLRVNPAFSPGHPFLQETISARDGDEISLPSDGTLHADYLAERNESLAWV
ncbi:HNH endonuclease [Haloarcula sp. AONF1]